MKKTIFFIFVLFISLITIQSCDKIEPPYKENNTITPGETNKRKVLLEDYTGHTCVNCPPAGVKATELKTVYGDQLVIITVHAGYFAAPYAAPFDSDYRTEAGNDWNSFFGIITNPKGMVSRLSDGGSQLVDYGEWGTRIGNLVDEDALASIEIETTYTESNRSLQIKTSTKFLQEMQGSYNIQLCLTEDSIVSPQRNNSATVGPVPTIEDYVHRHMLRQGINGSWGEPIVAGNNAIVAGQSYEHSYTMTLNSDFNVKHCSVVAFVYSTADYGILQVEEKHLGE